MLWRCNTRLRAWMFNGCATRSEIQKEIITNRAVHFHRFAYFYCSQRINVGWRLAAIGYRGWRVRTLELNQVINVDCSRLSGMITIRLEPNCGDCWISLHRNCYRHWTRMVFTKSLAHQNPLVDKSNEAIQRGVRYEEKKTGDFRTD